MDKSRKRYPRKPETCKLIDQYWDHNDTAEGSGAVLPISMDTMEPVEDIDYVCHDEHQLSRLLHFSAVVDLGKGGS